LIKTAAVEAQYSFVLRDSFALARSQPPVFSGKAFFITDSVQPSPADLEAIISSGGTARLNVA
jgi:hypothetical protein